MIINNGRKKTVLKDNNVYFDDDMAKLCLKKPLDMVRSLGETDRVLDACCWNGVLAKACSTFDGFGYEDTVYHGVDIRNAVIEVGGLTASLDEFRHIDIMDYNSDEKYDLIICNPPWSPVTLPMKILGHLMDNLLNKDGKILFVIYNKVWYQGKDRAIELENWMNGYFMLPKNTFKGKNLDVSIGLLMKDKLFNNISCTPYSEHPSQMIMP